MRESPRDTQFSGYAALVLKEIDEAIGEMSKQEIDEKAFANRLGTIIARRAYDLVQHAVESCSDQEDEMDSRIMADFLLKHIPDMTTWPEENKG